MAAYLPSLLALIVVIASIPAVLWLLKRLQTVRPSRNGVLAVVGGVALGPRERVAIIESGDRWLVVGVTAQTITLLDSRPRPADLPAEAPSVEAGTATDRAGNSGPTQPAQAHARSAPARAAVFSTLLRHARRHA